jgi:hypothetical protein
VSSQSWKGKDGLQAYIKQKLRLYLTRVSRMRLTFTNWAQAERNAIGLSTCSMTSIEHTMLNRLGSLTSCSTEVCRYSNGLPEEDSWGSPLACVEAIPMLDLDASMPRVRAPSLVRLWITESLDSISHVER